jgi:protein-disulfide isomerase
MPVRRRLRRGDAVLLSDGEDGQGRAPLTSRALYLLLAISIFTNVVLLVRFVYARQLHALVLRMQTPPAVVADDHARGPASAPHTVIVFMDYQCPYCAALNAEMRSVLSENRSRWIYRHFPIGTHPLAQSAAESAECSGAQGKFWEYSDRLFDTTTVLRDSTSLQQIAAGVGLDVPAFNACVAAGRYRARVIAQRDDGIKRQITGTPTLYIDGRRYDGMVPIEQLRVALR